MHSYQVKFITGVKGLPELKVIGIPCLLMDIRAYGAAKRRKESSQRRFEALSVLEVLEVFKRVGSLS